MPKKFKLCIINEENLGELCTYILDYYTIGRYEKHKVKKRF